MKKETSQPLTCNLIEKNRKQDRTGRSYDPKRYVIEDRIADHDPGILGGKQEFEILQAHPVAAQNALGEVQLFECDHNAEHRQIIVDNQIGQPRQYHQVIWEIIAAFFQPDGIFLSHFAKILQKQLR